LLIVEDVEPLLSGYVVSAFSQFNDKRSFVELFVQVGLQHVQDGHRSTDDRMAELLVYQLFAHRAALHERVHK
jgi:hypothetical protein